MKAPTNRPTDRQKRVLDFITDFTVEHGMPPTIREIAAGLGFASTNSVAGHLSALRRKDLLERASGKARGLKVSPDRTRQMHLLPVLGRIAAGRPIHAEENVEDYVAADPFLVRDSRDAFVLKVEGDSMSGDGILPGDYLYVRQQPVAEKGDIVVALIGDEATVKRYVPGPRGTIRLVASNPAYPPIEFAPDSTERLQILGVMVGLYRKI